MLSQQLDRARLGSFFAHLFGERDVRAHGEMAECAVGHAVSMKIDLVAVRGPKNPNSPDGSMVFTVAIG